MAPKKSASSSGTASVQGDAPVFSHSLQEKKLLKQFEGNFTTDIFVSLLSTISSNALGLGLAFLESIPNSFSPFYSPIPKELLEYQREIDVSKIHSSNTIRSWPIHSNKWIRWVNRLAKAKYAS